MRIVRTFVAGTVILLGGLVLQHGHGVAGDGGGLDGFQDRYGKLKTQTQALLTDLRKGNGSRPDRKALLHLRKEVMDFCFELRKHIYVHAASAATKPVSSQDRSQLLAISYACDAMEQVLEAEFDAQRGGETSNALRQIQEKYEEVWQVADRLATGH